MATPDEEVAGDDRGGVGPMKHDQKEAVHLDKVTDYVEEQIISGGDVTKFVSEIKAKEDEQKNIKDKELAKVVIKKEDVELIINEMEISKGSAERALREHRGDIIRTLHTLTN
jgi:NACalpha-BTF3-like transcription factor